jgi:hypothetical protein
LPAARGLDLVEAVDVEQSPVQAKDVLRSPRSVVSKLAGAVSAEPREGWQIMGPDHDIHTVDLS